MIDYFYLALFYSFRFIIKYTPKFILNPFFTFLSFVIFKIDKKHRKVAKVNLDLAFESKYTEDEKMALIRKYYKNILFILADFVKNQGATKEEILKKVTFENEEILTKYLKQNKRIITMTAHYGNWELLSLAVAAKFTPLSIVGRDLDSSVMNKILMKNREQFDIEILSKSGAMKGLIKALKNNRPVGLLVDQNTKSNEGELVDFFSKKARHTPSAAILAKKFDAVIIPAFITTHDNYETYVIKFYEPILYDENDDENSLLKCIQAQADVTQKAIEEKPDEWFWLHKRWKNQYEYLYKN